MRRAKEFKLFVCAMSIASLALTSCGIDDTYDLSKDFDNTIAIGNGVSIPVGNLDKIYLTEMIDPAEDDVIKIDDSGFYSVKKDGTFDPENFTIDNVNINVKPDIEERKYDLDLKDLKDEYDKLPPAWQEIIDNLKHPYIVNEDIDNKVSFAISQEVPEEIKKLKKATFRNPVYMNINLQIYTNNTNSKELLAAVGELNLKNDNYKGFAIDLPEYLVIKNNANIVDNKLIITEPAKYDATTGSISLPLKYEIEALDFTKLSEGYLEVVNGRINISEEFHAQGYIESDTILLSHANLREIEAVYVKPEVTFSTMQIDEVTGCFDPEIDPINESVALNLDDDLDFLKEEGAKLVFTNPQIRVTINNPIDAQITIGKIDFASYDASNSLIEGSNISSNNYVLAAAVENKFHISRTGVTDAGYTGKAIADLNKLMSIIPDKIDVAISNIHMDSNSDATVKLGSNFEISGEYSVDIPLDFEDFNITYTESVEDVLGDDPTEITDYITDVTSVTVTFKAYNTAPVEFTPEVIALNKYGTPLQNIVADVQNKILAGGEWKGTDNTTPVMSEVTIKLSALNGELKDLNNLDIKFHGRGNGVFNKNEYIEIKDIAITIDTPIHVEID